MADPGVVEVPEDDAPAAHVERPRSPLLSRSGAVAGEGLDAGVAWHYGDPMREQRLLAEGLAVVDLSHRGVVTVTGPDRLSWLHSLTTQQLTNLPPRTSTEALMLSPKGHVEHALHVVDDGETTWLTCEPGTNAALAAWLTSMRFMLRVEVNDRTSDLAVVGEPTDSEGVAGEPPTWRDPWPHVAEGGASYAAVDGTLRVPVRRPGARVPDAGIAGAAGEPSDAQVVEPHPGEEWAWREVIVPRAELEQVVADRALAGTWALEALRVAAWRPRLGHETDHRTIPHEVDWLRTAVHLHKGCYRGQETVARVHNLGRPPRRLVMLHLDGSAHLLPGADADVMAGEKRVGQVTTSARHYELGPIALAVVKRNLPLDTQLVVDGIDAAQEAIVAP
ncbi:MAG TPA: folate-binding protein [Actinomycetales bacterium]|nr:folate-binding protein [Actinomycetales bacterium]